MYQIFYNILYLSIIGSILGIIVIVFRKSFDRKISPTWKLAMWVLVLVSLIVPARFTIQSQNSHQFIISSSIDKIENVKESLIATESGKVLIYVWLIVMCIIFLYYVVTSILMRNKIGKKIVENEQVLDILEDCKKQMGIKKKINLIEQDYKKVPCIYGIFNTKILITKEVLEKDEDCLRYIFFHELAHFKRHDLIINKLLILITTIHWFNPILWYCFMQVRQDMELKADEMVLDKIKKEEEKNYAKTLVRLLPISQEERKQAKVLCITDGKKNMERRINMIKLSEKFKEYKVLIGITTLLIVLCVGMFIFTRIRPQEEVISNNVRYFEMPDRIVYKKKGKDNYYVFTGESKDYTDILNELINGIDSIGEGPVVSNEEIRDIEENENYIELDYDTISKNYVIAYEEQTNNVILRNDNGGQVVKQNLKNKDKLAKLMEEKIISNSDNCYHMSDSKEYKVKSEISEDIFASNVSEFRLYEIGIYGIKIQSKEKLDEILNRYNIEIEEEIPENIFEKTDIILMVSKYDIKNIETRVGGLTYTFTGKERVNTYLVNIFAASKAINTNCVYRNLSDISYINISSIDGAIVTSVKGDNITVEADNGESFEMTLNSNLKVVNRRTNETFNIKNIKVNDKLDLENIYKNQGEITFADNGEIYVIRNIHGEELKQELVRGEFDFDLESINKEGNNYVLKGVIRDLYYNNDYSKAESFDIEVIVNNNTQILGVTGKPEEQLNTLNVYDNIYLTLDKTELEKGNLVAANVEVMGC